MQSHDFCYCFVILKVITWYMILLIPGNEFRIWKVKVDGRDGNVDERINGSKLVVKAMKGTYFDARRSFLENCRSVGKIFLLIAKRFIADAVIFLICLNIYRFSNSMFMKA